MKRYSLLLIILLASQLNAIACDCSRIKNLKEAKKSSYDESDLIFTARTLTLGESMQYKQEGWFNNIIFEVEVLENFKGTEVGKVLKGHALTSCSGYPRDAGTWLIYANLNDEGLIVFSNCGLSRSFQKPENIIYDQYTPKPPTKEDLEDPDSDINWAIERASARLRAAQDLKEEIFWLRSLK